jgi:hypothetical protein
MILNHQVTYYKKECYEFFTIPFAARKTARGSIEVLVLNFSISCLIIVIE